MRMQDARTGTFDRNAAKKAVNLSVNADLLRKARQAGLNLSQTLEHALELATRDIEQKRWLDENRDAIQAYNDHVERDGVFSAGLRTF